MNGYLKRIRRCRSRNEANRLHIDLEQDMPPRQFAKLARRGRTRKLPKETCEWLKKIEGFSPAIFERPQRYRRRQIADGVALYSNVRRAAQAKQVLFAFTGNSGRLMLPLAVALQGIDSRVWDVVLIKKRSAKTPYLSGIEGIADDFDGVVRFLEETTGPKQYRGVATFGTSSGGYAAILAAIALGARFCVSVGGRFPVGDEGRSSKRKSLVADAAAPDIRYAFAAANTNDRDNAIALQTAFGGQLHPLSPFEKHNVLFQMVLRGELDSFMGDLFPFEQASRIGRLLGPFGRRTR